MRPRDVNPNTTKQDFARQFPILATHVGSPEPLAWARYQVAALIHDTERTPRTWLPEQTVHHEWTVAFLGDERRAP
jgi:hypothetical protein